MRIKNWEKFQHFKDRRPPWIKLYRDILDDFDWFNLDPAASKTLIMLWLIASEDNNKSGELPDIKTICFRLRIEENKLIQQLKLLDHWIDTNDINVISERYQNDIPETETETETETDIIDTNVSITTNDETVHDLNIDIQIPPCPHKEIINLYAKHIPTGIQPRSWDGARALALKSRWKESKKRQSLTWWEGFFEHISKSKFLTGQKIYKDRDPFEITLPWVLKKENFNKIIEGVYHR